MSTFYPQNDYRGYLSHHGIKGQKWGEQNGPPYPLSTKIHNMVVRGREKRAAKRRSKILHDPRKLSKHAQEFSKEEIDAAIAKIKSVNEAKAMAGKSMSQKAKEKIAANAENKRKQKAYEKFNKKVSKYATVDKLEKYQSKLSPEEIEAALKRIGQNQRIFEAKIAKIDRPRVAIETGANYLGTITKLITNAKKFKDNTKKQKFDEMTYKEKHREWLIEQGKIALLDSKEVDAYSKSKKIEDNENLAKLKEIKSNLEKELSNTKTELENVRRESGSAGEAAYFANKIDDILTEYDYNIVDFATDTKTKDVPDELVSEFDYLVQRGYFDEDMKQSDPEIDWSIFSDVKMSEIDNLFS